ncbi:MAG: glutamine synthetase family protein [candidate division WOR-3 bacterium]
MTRAEIIREIKKNDVKFIDLWFSDILGSIKNVTITIVELQKALEDGIWFDGSSVEGFGRICESDMFLRPDPSTFRIIPWNVEKTARFICDVYGPDHKPSLVDPRGVLKSLLVELKKKGMEFNVGAELEFYLFQRDGSKITPLLHDQVGYFDLGGDLALRVRKAMCEKLAQFGIVVEAGHHEVGKSQHEIDLRYTNALQLADNILTAKMVIKRIAEEHNLYATFMPKPIFGMAGCGMHIHQSIFKNGKNIFADTKDDYGLSEIAYNYLAGILKHIKEISAVISPLVNSYKRLVSGYEAPVYICWGQMNRSALVRIPKISKNRLKSTRLELRSPDPSSNPYLAFALILASGLDGIKNRIKPPQAVEENVYKIEQSNLNLKKIDLLPRSLWEALQFYHKSKLVRETLGETLFQRYYEIKSREYSEYATQVSQWEIDKYLEIY